MNLCLVKKLVLSSFQHSKMHIVLEEDLADEGIDVGISSEQATVISTSQHQAF